MSEGKLQSFCTLIQSGDKKDAKKFEEDLYISWVMEGGKDDLSLNPNDINGYLRATTICHLAAENFY